MKDLSNIGQKKRDGNDPKLPMNSIRVVNAQELRARIRFEDLIEAVSRAFQDSVIVVRHPRGRRRYPGLTDLRP